MASNQDELIIALREEVKSLKITVKTLKEICERNGGELAKSKKENILLKEVNDKLNAR